MDVKATEDAQYDGFASYATDPDRAVVRDVEIFLEGLHQNTLVFLQYRRPLELCVDGSDFRLPRRFFKRDEAPEAGLRDILTAYLAQSRQLVLFVAPRSARHPWVNFELDWWVETRGPQSILVAVTHGSDPKNERPATFPEAILRHGIDQWLWFDLRGFRNRDGIDVRDDSEEGLRLAAAPMGPDVSAADLITGWRRGLALQRKRQLIVRIFSEAALALGVAVIAWLLYLWDKGSIQARVSDWALASQHLEAGALNRRLDGLAYALASMSEKPTPEGYSSLISAMEPLVVHRQRIRRGLCQSSQSCLWTPRPPAARPRSPPPQLREKASGMERAAVV